MSTSTTTTVVVSPRVWSVYDNVTNNGMSIKDASAAAVPPYSGGGGAAALKRVKDAIASGATVEVEGVEGPATEGTVTVDRYAIADEMLPGASAFLLTVDRIASEKDRIEKRALKLEAEAATVRESIKDVDAKVSDARSLMERIGFDFEAFEATVLERKAAGTDDATDDDATDTDAK